jgi:hypothetical protein
LAILLSGCIVVNQQAVATSAGHGQASAVVSSGRNVVVAQAGGAPRHAPQQAYVPPGVQNLDDLSPADHGQNAVAIGFIGVVLIGAICLALQESGPRPVE